MKWRALIPGVLLIAVFFAGARLNLRYLLDRSTLDMEMGLIALGMTMVIVCGQIDLSVASNLVLTACLTGRLMEKGLGIPATILASCLIGTALGAVNGVLVAKLKLPSFLVTLGTMATYRGAAQAMMGPNSAKLPKVFTGLDQALFLGTPWPVVIFLVMAALMGLLLHQTVFGRWVFAVGTNESAARYSGIPIARVKILVFAILGLMCGVGALMLNSRLGFARYDFAPGLELDAITVAVVGGTAISGGSGSIMGSVLALFLIDMIKTRMGIANVKAEYQLTAIGTLLILTVLIMNVANTLRWRRAATSGEKGKPVKVF